MSKRWTKQEAAAFLLKTGELLEQGYTIDQVLYILTWEQPDKIKQVIYSMMDKLRTGSTFHEVLSQNNFPSDITAYVFFSEQYGSLQDGLQGAGGLYQQRLDTIQSIRRVLRYPLILIWTLLMLSVVMFHFLFPQFRELFLSMNVDLPVFTRYMIHVINLSPYLLFTFFLLVAGILCYYYQTFRHYTSQKQVQLLCYIPFFSSYLRLFLTYYFSLQLSCMLKGGLSIYKACQLLEKQNHFLFFQEEGFDIKEQLKQGNPLFSILEDKVWCSYELKYVIQHGQVAGKLGNDLYYYSERVWKLLDRKIKKAVMTLQPIMFSIIGFIILSMFLAVFLPMFQLMTSIQ